LYKYADDIFLMSHSSYSMQSMLDICSIEIAKLRLHFNSKKSVTLRIGPRHNSDCASFYLDGILNLQQWKACPIHVVWK